ncbi:putative low-affinity inorganic phosphate transporter [Streptomyces litmocidini]|uniref:inorganic phosphate transporter n=1 Tax=Streptomyces litmocidini TaxID=67318 RepID=UPI00167E31B4|nr:inorganic phosphate transporter [Streptomyces litmocidini]GGU80411.1 putative low-affinity inorganic phosphate transporter [Streptomyces litmocidini]
MVTVALYVTAVAFVFICGANDGGALLALAVRHRGRSIAFVSALLAVAVALGPNLFGLAVARAFTDHLGEGPPETARLVFLAGAGAATVLVLLLTRAGVPTSLTLATLGGLAGADVALGVRPSWGLLGVILLVAAAAPLVGAAAGWLIGRAARRIPAVRGMPRLVHGLQLVAFGTQCLAYAANDGQKMFAVVAVAFTGDALLSHPWQVGDAMIAAVFTAGALAGLHRIAHGATSRLIVTRPWQVLSAELASSATVLSSAGLGMPVSMTQSVAGGLVGTGASEGGRRVRWQYALPLLASWLVTLPGSFVAGTLAGLFLEGVITWSP